jgi:hypothetical protein
MREESEFKLLEELEHPALGKAIYDKAKDLLYLSSSILSTEELLAYQTMKPSARVRAAETDGETFILADDMAKVASDPTVVVEKELAWRKALYAKQVH